MQFNIIFMIISNNLAETNQDVTFNSFIFKYCSNLPIDTYRHLELLTLSLNI